MKLNFNKKYTTVAIYACLVIIFAVICVYVIMSDTALSSIFSKVKAFLTPILVGLLITYFVTPLYNLFDRKILAFVSKKNDAKMAKRLRVKHIMSLIFSYIIMLALIAVFFWLIIPQLILSVNSLTSQITSYVGPVKEFITSLDNRTDTLGKVYKFIKPYIAEGDIVNNLSSTVTSFMGGISAILIEFITGTVSVIKYIVLGLFFSIYFLMYKKQTEMAFNRILSAFFPEKVAHFIRHLVELIDLKFGHFLKGQSVDSLIIACVTWLTLTIIGFEYSLLIALLVGVTNMIPVFGPFLGAIPSGLLIFLTEPEPLKMVIIFAVFVLVIQQIDGNVLVPLILGDAIGLSPLLILISITVMGSLFGVLGMFIGVPTFAVICTLVTEAVDKRLEGSKKLVEVIPVDDDGAEFTDGEQMSMIDADAEENSPSDANETEEKKEEDN